MKKIPDTSDGLRPLLRHSAYFIILYHLSQNRETRVGTENSVSAYLLAKFLNVKLFHDQLNFLKVSIKFKIFHRLLNETNECRKLGTAYQQSSET